MSTLEDVVLKTLLAGVEGGGAHADSSRALDGLDWRLAGKLIEGAPYTVMQSANHIIWWNGYTLSHFRGETPTPPAHAVDGWPGPAAPASDEEWQAFIRAYKASLEALAAAAREGRFTEPLRKEGRPRADILRAMGQHVTYHVGQIALLRRMMGAWPPPGGGDTW